ncbi:MAG: hypothetical protein ACJAZO_001513 [Myxococcota bacterium]|jgi:hypothetical protein
MRRLLLLSALVPTLALAGPRADQLALQAEEKLANDELIGARGLAEDALALDSEQYRAHYVLGMVQRDSEGNLAQAMYHLGESRRSYETRYATSLDTEWRFHQNLIYVVQLVAGEIEEYDYQLDIIEFYNARYDPDLTGERAWPLMKLGRLDEARTAAADAVALPDEWQQSVGLNAQCALESEAGSREQAHVACMAALEAERLSPEADVTVDAYNASLSAFQSLRYEQGEALALEANTGSTVSTANPWAVLAGAYVAQGRGTDAVAAVRSMQGWRSRMDPELRDMNRAELDAVFAIFLLTAGEPELGYDVISRAIDFPDRRALTSGSSDQARGGHALLRIALRRALRERQREQAATQGIGKRFTGAIGRLVPDTLDWEDRAAVVAVLSNGKRLDQTLRMYLDGGLQSAPPWLLGELIPVLGTGVVSEALARARTAEPSPGMASFYDAVEAEVAWWSGRYTRARELADAAARDLPSEEVLLRARVQALAGDAAWRQGDMADRLLLMTDAMQADPSVMRRLGLTLPATVSQVSGGQAATYAENMLWRSPRLNSESNAFVVSITAQSDVLRICLTSPGGLRLSCGIEPRQPAAVEGEEFVEWTDWERAQYTVDSFHRTSFGLPTGLSRTEMSGLDGTNTIDTQAARQEMESLLQDLITPASD